jgi:NAD-dependent dihydropyrimidine dehydrogenase PreA subunit
MTEAVDLKRRNFLLGRLARASQAAGPAIAVIGPSCLTFRGIACMSCRDVCPVEAVRFELVVGGACPTILTDTCTGCGACARSCPADAIQISAPEAMA